ncbi:type IV pilin-like G/H family protein [Tychonema sp. BBK16]|uniref:type IV pilin-like G/H family protein n=1 Tax=Tychonema sp. BBK16 TaxID=2699888 RepID=UPI0038D2DAC7
MSQKNPKPAIISHDGCGCIVLLMCIIVMGAIALPSYLSMANRARQSEAKQYLSSMNKGQQAYYAEKSAFSNSIPDLGLGIKTETPNYKYSLRVTKQAAFNYGVSKQKTEISYVGGVFRVPVQDVQGTTAILCKNDYPGTIEPAEPTYQNGKVICAKGTTEVTK